MSQENVSADRALALPNSMDDLLSGEDTGAKGSATGQDIRDALSTEPQLDTIKIVHAAQLFELPGQDKKVPEFVGIIGGFTYRNAWFAKDLDEAEEEDRRPACYARDALTPSDGAPEKQSSSCGTCKRNRNAEDPAARSHAWEELSRKEACGNYLELAIFVDSPDVPYRLQIPASGFARKDSPWNQFVKHIGTRRKALTCEVVTRFTLKEAKGQGQTYSIPEFHLVKVLENEQHREFFRKRAADVRALLRREGFTGKQQGSEAGEAASEARAAAKEAAAKGDAGL